MQNIHFVAGDSRVEACTAFLPFLVGFAFTDADVLQVFLDGP